MAEKGADVSNEVMDRAKNLCNKTVTASNRTMEMYTNVKEKSEKAIEGSKAVEKINELTNTIMEISSQTGLLALNASIELREPEKQDVDLQLLQQRSEVLQTRPQKQSQISVIL